MVSSGKAEKHITYEDFRHVCHKWHLKITKSFIFLLESKEYNMVRNAIIAMTKVRRVEVNDADHKG